MIERGKEWVPGTFPDKLKDVIDENRFAVQGKDKFKMTNPLGLVNMVQNDEINVMSGSGLGGTSLLNANVAIRPDADVFNIPQWPAALRDRSVLDAYFDLASVELGVQKVPIDSVLKMTAQRMAAENMASMGAHYSTADITVKLDRMLLDAENRNRRGMIQRLCSGCGDCTIGCNVGAKILSQ